MFTCASCGGPLGPSPVDSTCDACHLRARTKEADASAVRRAGLEELRGRAATLDAKRSAIGAWIFLVCGVGFVGLSSIALVGLVRQLLPGAKPAALLGPALFALLFLSLAGGFLVYGARTLRRLRREARLRQDGLPGTATVLACEESLLRLDGRPLFTLHLRIEAPGLAAYEVTLREAVPVGVLIYKQSTLRVRVSKTPPHELLLEW